jgi:hypothetical protein
VKGSPPAWIRLPWIRRPRVEKEPGGRAGVEEAVAEAVGLGWRRSRAGGGVDKGAGGVHARLRCSAPGIARLGGV